MTTFIEGNLQITIPDGLFVRKFDDEATHRLTHCMKAVDYIVELPDKFLFIEIKDPEDPTSRPETQAEFIGDFLAGRIDENLKYKYRDSFLYEWASQTGYKPIYYFVLIAIQTLTAADLLARTDDLKRKIPVRGPQDGRWKRKIVEDVAVFNISTWNENLPDYPITRLSS